MKNRKLLKYLAGLGVGLGIGSCFAVAMDNPAGILLGLGIGLCFAVSFASREDNKDGEDKK